jgi:biopolymer transport protein ExbB
MKPIFASLPASLIKRLVLPVLFLAWSVPAHAWWSHDWSYRKQLTLDPQAAGLSAAGDQTNAVVLIRLHEGVFGFADANPDGSDLRFIGEDDKTPLRYHIERFDSVFNLAFAWVQIPLLKAGQPTKIWLYYGNAKATADSRAADSYDPNQLLVYHFGEKGTPPADSTAFKLNATTAALPDDNGLIAAAARFDGNTAVVLPVSPSLNLAAGQNASFSMWVKPAAAADAVLFSQRDANGNALIIGTAAGVPYVSLELAGAPTGRAQAASAIADGSWHHLAVVAAPQLTLYIDGVAKGSLAASLPAIGGAAVLGGDGGTGGAPVRSGFAGEIDELEIAKVARAPGALLLAAENQGTTDKLVSFGADEQQSSWSTGYIGIIMGSVTLDGWVIIGVLIVMMVISWTIMATKSVQIGRVARGNRAFLEAFRASNGEFQALQHALKNGPGGAGAESGLQLSEDDRDLIEDSPLLQMFTLGVDELRSRLTGEGGSRGRDDYLSEQSIEAIRASIDSSLVEQLQALNRRMVLLTIAISGGPFIGLLGTVVGVMITFAAVAAAGDVNINAIAPGIAAALAATVAGLFVAIPALFGYNYLITRIKECAAEMQVFTNSFVTRMAENYNQPAALHAVADQH